jgi:hypothetical protein
VTVGGGGVETVGTVGACGTLIVGGAGTLTGGTCGTLTLGACGTFTFGSSAAEFVGVSPTPKAYPAPIAHATVTVLVIAPWRLLTDCPHRAARRRWRVAS